MKATDNKLLTSWKVLLKWLYFLFLVHDEYNQLLPLKVMFTAFYFRNSTGLMLWGRKIWFKTLLRDKCGFHLLYLTKLQELHFNGSYLYLEWVNIDRSTWCCVQNPLSDQVAEYRRKDDCVRRVRTKLQHQLEEWRGVQMLRYCSTLKRMGKQTTSHDVQMAVWHLNASQGST